MAKVVGKDEKALKRITCKHCAAILEYEQREVKESHGTDYGGGPDGMEWVDCPNCGDKAVIRSW